MAAELETTTGGALALSPGQQTWTPPQLAALKQLGLEDATPDDLAVFLHVAQRSGLDPFARQIYMIARNQNVKNEQTGRWDKKARFTIQTGIDGFRLIADRTGKYEGQTEPEWCGEDGVWHSVWLAQGPPAAARVGVYKRHFRGPIYAVAVFREYAGTKTGGELTSMWASKPSIMIGKCAEALALRKAFPQDLSGLYTAEEMAQADTEPRTALSSVPDSRVIDAAEAPQIPVTLPDDFEQMIKDAESRLDLADLGNLAALAKESQNMVARATVTAAWKRVVAARKKIGLQPGDKYFPDTAETAATG